MERELSDSLGEGKEKKRDEEEGRKEGRRFGENRGDVQTRGWNVRERAEKRRQPDRNAKKILEWMEKP